MGGKLSLPAQIAKNKQVKIHNSKFEKKCMTSNWKRKKIFARYHSALILFSTKLFSIYNSRLYIVYTVVQT